MKSKEYISRGKYSQRQQCDLILRQACAKRYNHSNILALIILSFQCLIYLIIGKKLKEIKQ